MANYSQQDQLTGQGDIYSCIQPRDWIFRAPSPSAAVETECLFGNGFRVEKSQAGWVYGQAVSPVDIACPGYVGWMRREALSMAAAPATHHVHSLKAPVFSGKDIKSPILRVLPLNALLRVSAQTGAFLQLAKGGFVHLNHAAPLGEYEQTDFVAAAQAHIGLPYIWAGVSTDGLDCSGLIQSSLRACGRDCLRDAGQQETSLGTPVSLEADLMRGDLIFWAGHVGVMIGPDTLLHANAHHMRVEAERLDTAVARIGAPRSIRRLPASAIEGE